METRSRHETDRGPSNSDTNASRWESSHGVKTWPGMDAQRLAGRQKNWEQKFVSAV